MKVTKAFVLMSVPQVDLLCAHILLVSARVNALHCRPALIIGAHVQIQYSLLDRRPDNRMVDFCSANNISILPFGVVAGGLLSDKYLGKGPTSCV